MVTTTTSPGLVNIDPIQGLENYVNDIKPFHTKVFEVLAEYVYTDYVNVTIVDQNVIAVDVTQADALDPTFNENGGFTYASGSGNVQWAPTNITEMFDFFITAPTPTTLAITSTDVTNAILNFAGNVTSDFELNDLIVVTGSTSGNDGYYQLLSVGYNATTSQTVVTLNTLAGTDGTTGSVTIYHTDTTSNFAYPIASADVGPVTIEDPVTGTSFSVSTFTVAGNVTRAIQPGSVFQGVTALNTPPTKLYHAEVVQFIPSFNSDGSRNRSGDTTIIGVKLDSVFTDNVISSGFLIPYNITGYDGRYDGPYDQMAGYLGISD